MTNSLSRRIGVFAKDKYGNPLNGVKFSWKINGEDAGIVTSASQCSIELNDKNALLNIVAEHKGIKKEITLSKEANTYTFDFDVSVYPYWREFFMKHFSAVIGIVFIIVAAVLAFAFKEPNYLQRQIILALFALGGGGFGAEIAGFIKVDMKLHDKLVVAAGGAAAIFVLLFFFIPAGAELSST